MPFPSSSPLLYRASRLANIPATPVPVYVLLPFSPAMGPSNLTVGFITGAGLSDRALAALPDVRGQPARTIDRLLRQMKGRGLEMLGSTLEEIRDKMLAADFRPDSHQPPPPQPTTQDDEPSSATHPPLRQPSPSPEPTDPDLLSPISEPSSTLVPSPPMPSLEPSLPRVPSQALSLSDAAEAITRHEAEPDSDDAFAQSPPGPLTPSTPSSLAGFPFPFSTFLPPPPTNSTMCTSPPSSLASSSSTTSSCSVILQGIDERPNARHAVLLPRDQWKKDEGVFECEEALCKTKFGLVERRHHCRRCGGVFCAACTDYIEPLLDTSQMPWIIPPPGFAVPTVSTPELPIIRARVCVECWAHLHGKLEQTGAGRRGSRFVHGEEREMEPEVIGLELRRTTSRQSTTASIVSAASTALNLMQSSFPLLRTRSGTSLSAASTTSSTVAAATLAPGPTRPGSPHSAPGSPPMSRSTSRARRLPPTTSPRGQNKSLSHLASPRRPLMVLPMPEEPPRRDIVGEPMVYPTPSSASAGMTGYPISRRNSDNMVAAMVPAGVATPPSPAARPHQQLPIQRPHSSQSVSRSRMAAPAPVPLTQEEINARKEAERRRREAEADAQERPARQQALIVDGDIRYRRWYVPGEELLPGAVPIREPRRVAA